MSCLNVYLSHSTLFLNGIICGPLLGSFTVRKKKKKKKKSRHSIDSILFCMRVEHKMRLFVIEILFTSEPLFK